MAFREPRGPLGPRTPGRPTSPPHRGASGRSFKRSAIHEDAVPHAQDAAHRRCEWESGDVATPIGRSRCNQLSRYSVFTSRQLPACANWHRFCLFWQERAADCKWRARHFERINSGTPNSSFWNDGSRNKRPQRQVCRRQSERSRSVRARSSNRPDADGRASPWV
jgi:hypothetical protein